MSATPNHLTTLTIVAVPSIVALAAALAVTHHFVHPAVIVMIMIAKAANPLARATTPTSGTMISLPILHRLFLITALESTVILTDPLSHMAIG